MSNVRLSRRLVLESPQRSDDGAGGFVEAWAPMGELWADVSARSGRERVAATAPVSAMSYKIVVRAAPYGSPARPQPEQRFREGSRVFNIKAVAERDPEGRHLTCFADEEVAV
ncbi:MAG: phage head closure protein [Paracoccaceae bacterium]